MSDITKIKIVADSSCDLYELDLINYDTAALKILTSEKEFVDDCSLDTSEMVEYLLSYKGKSSSSCPNVYDWLKAFGDAEEVYCITITSTLSGSYNSALLAKKQYEEKYPDRKVFVFDSLSTGPEMTLIIYKIRELVLDCKSYDDVTTAVKNYASSTGLLFMLSSMKNLANNGRVSPIVAKIAGVLGIRVIGKASDKGDLQQLYKCRGENKGLETIVEHLKKDGLKKGRVIISHCINENAALKLKELLLNEFKDINVLVQPCRGLCSFYAEKGGLLIGYERF